MNKKLSLSLVVLTMHALHLKGMNQLIEDVSQKNKNSTVILLKNNINDPEAFTTLVEEHKDSLTLEDIISLQSDIQETFQTIQHKRRTLKVTWGCGAIITCLGIGNLFYNLLFPENDPNVVLSKIKQDAGYTILGASCVFVSKEMLEYMRKQQQNIESIRKLIQKEIEMKKNKPTE